MSESYEIKEDLFGLAQLDKTTAAHIHLIIKDCLLCLGIPIANCRGLAYDGAANFQGCINGVAKKIESENPAAISVHCLAHCVNLCLQDIARGSSCIKEALNFAMEFIQLIKYSPKQQVLFETV